MIRYTGVAIAAVLAVVVAGCGCTSPVPAGVQELHVVITSSEVRLNPSTVHRGDVYVVMDVPCSHVRFLWRAGGPVEIAPLSDDDLARFRRGDEQGTGMSGFDNNTCPAPSSNGAGDRMGECGNVQKMVLSEGKYAFFLEAADGVTPRAIAVLEVVP